MPSSAALKAYKEREAMMKDDPLSGAEIPILLDTAKEIIEKLSQRTNCFEEEREQLFPRFERKELQLSRVLGRGGFCVVNEVKGIKLDSGSAAAKDEAARNKDKELSQYEEAFTRDFVATRSLREGKVARYAIKQLSDACHNDNHLFLKGIIDLALEAKFLAVLEHPHIIKMRAVASVGPVSKNYFLILDRLYDTLEQRIRSWKAKKKRGKSFIGKVTGAKKKKNEIELERMVTSADLASAMKYMHDQSIIYRDLKPDNIGFDVRGDVKIFDFGLAKELRDDIKYPDGTYKLTGFTGSMRYMAPEVAKSLPYGLSADVYSFGILFWSIIAMDTPYAAYSCKMHEERVVTKGYRPACDKSWPEVWSNLMKKSWSPTPADRPSFKEIVTALNNECELLTPSDGSSKDDRLDSSRRSTRDILLSKK
uniref:Protein kinase domain-containing protein n=1 Tax=Ditylum brightwellii TaxID=49249 RepID=A0A7S1YST7_9STRA